MMIEVQTTIALYFNYVNVHNYILFELVFIKVFLGLCLFSHQNNVLKLNCELMLLTTTMRRYHYIFKHSSKSRFRTIINI
jgi:hypothetical protein